MNDPNPNYDYFHGFSKLMTFDLFKKNCLWSYYKYLI